LDITGSAKVNLVNNVPEDFRRFPLMGMGFSGMIGSWLMAFEQPPILLHGRGR
jgi:hypothetical protein